VSDWLGSKVETSQPRSDVRIGCKIVNYFIENVWLFVFFTHIYLIICLIFGSFIYLFSFVY